eukprot:8282796-Alexandrium_andersonii.AAC.1
MGLRREVQVPRRNAVLASSVKSGKPSCTKRKSKMFRVSRRRVGAAVLIVPRSGSRYPQTTRRALALRPSFSFVAAVTCCSTSV